MSSHFTVRYIQLNAITDIMPLWPNEKRFETPGLKGAPSNCRKPRKLINKHFFPALVYISRHRYQHDRMSTLTRERDSCNSTGNPTNSMSVLTKPIHEIITASWKQYDAHACSVVLPQWRNFIVINRTNGTIFACVSIVSFCWFVTTFRSPDLVQQAFTSLVI
jgi:hypothetical protein